MHDPDLDGLDTKGGPTSARRGPAWVHWLCAIPVVLVVLSALPLVVRPFRYAERLNHPVAVAGVTQEALRLADGTLLRVPYIRRIPRNDPVLGAVLERGVERDSQGKVHALLTVYPTCGMTLYRHYTYRVNLGHVIAALDPTALDEPRIPPEEIRSLSDMVSRPEDPRRVRDYFLSSVRRVREVVDFHEAHPTGPGPS
jgi:hypothetical protein